MTIITELAPNLFRISVYVPALDLQFNQFLVCDEEPLLFATGMRAFFPTVREAVGLLLDPTQLRWVAFSHFEADECGSLNEWLELAPQATPVCGQDCATVNIDDWALRPTRGLADGELLATGRQRFRFVSTPHLPHTWDAGMLFEETGRTLLCSDLFFQAGNQLPLTDDLVAAAAPVLELATPHPFAGMFRLTVQTEALLNTLVALAPGVIGVGHGASFVGDGAGALRQLAGQFAHA